MSEPQGTVLLTGAAGRIGGKVLRRLLEKGYRVRALVHRRKPEGVTHENLEIFAGDILKQEDMKRAMEGCAFVAHLAAAWDMFPPLVHEKENNQLFESIIRGTYNLLEASYARRDLKVFLYASTDAVYATGPRKFSAPITEDTELQPSRFYALAKITCETLCHQYGKLYGLPWLIVRICWALDPEELLHVFSYEFWKDAMSEEDRRRLEPQLAAGIVQGIESHARGVGGTFNLAGPAPFRYRDVIEKLAADLGVAWGSARVTGSEPYELRNDRAMATLGYAPQWTMVRMLEKAARLRSGEAVE